MIIKKEPPINTDEHRSSDSESVSIGVHRWFQLFFVHRSSFIVHRFLFCLLIVLGAGWAAPPLPPFLGVERLSNGNTLMVQYSLDWAVPIERVIEVNPLGQVVWAYLKQDVLFPHTARRIEATGNTLISDATGNRVLEVDRLGNLVWSMSEGLNYPNEAIRLANGNTLITDRNNNRVIEVQPDSTIVWSYDSLDGPHNGNFPPNAHLLVCNALADTILELNPDGAIVWQYSGGLDWPRCAQRLANGHTLITSSLNFRDIEVDSSGNVVWSYSCPSEAFMSTRLANGHTLIGANAGVTEIDSAAHVVWRWPNTVATRVDTLFVYNPSSGCSLLVHIHRPITATDSTPLPAIILVPDSSLPGAVYDTNGLANEIASDGFVVMHFDADGRGGSGAYPENWDGAVNQDGLKACAQTLAREPYVDTTRIGILSQGYGITMAAGMLARYADSTPVRFLLDFEGPTDRGQSCADSGGPVPVSADSDAFWQEREAVRDMSRIRCSYLRMQTGVTKYPTVPAGLDAIALVDSATGGAAHWTRVNDSVMNQPNQTYTAANPPVWIPAVEDRNDDIRYLLYLREMAQLVGPLAIRTVTTDRPPTATRISVSPNPVAEAALVRYEVPRNTTVSVSVFDASGRLVRRLVQGPVSAGEHQLSWNCTARDGRVVAPGVYFIRLQNGSSAGTCKVLKE
jgi:hypothetical protein